MIDSVWMRVFSLINRVPRDKKVTAIVESDAWEKTQETVLVVSAERRGLLYSGIRGSGGLTDVLRLLTVDQANVISVTFPCGTVVDSSAAPEVLASLSSSEVLIPSRFVKESDYFHVYHATPKTERVSFESLPEQCEFLYVYFDEESPLSPPEYRLCRKETVDKTNAVGLVLGKDNEKVRFFVSGSELVYLPAKKE